MRGLLVVGVIVASLTLSGCSDAKTGLSGKACLGANSGTLVEALNGQCKAGDIVATKHPAYFCDFNYAVAFNSYNSATCVYNGKLREERVK